MVVVMVVTMPHTLPPPPLARALDLSQSQLSVCLLFLCGEFDFPLTPSITMHLLA